MLQIDRIALWKKNNRTHLIRVGNTLINSNHILTNEKITDYIKAFHCPKCHMIMDIGERGECKYCTGEYFEDKDGEL
jgi:hypothetical protein